MIIRSLVFAALYLVCHTILDAKCFEIHKDGLRVKRTVNEIIVRKPACIKRPFVASRVREVHPKNGSHVSNGNALAHGTWSFHLALGKLKDPSASDNLVPQKSEEVDKWIWGNEEVSTQRTEPEFPIPDRLQEEKNPCDEKPATMPNFSKPGRRISQQKCYEYIWNVKFREDNRLRDEACKAYNKKHGIITFGIEAIGGRDALPGEFPHMGAIGWKAATGTWLFKCGSSLISSKFALTAAHCAQASTRDTTVADVIPKIIRFGDKNIIDDYANGLYPTDAEITKITVHPEYKSPKKYYDIALMELLYDLEFNYNVQPACLWKDFDLTPLGTKASLTGWGVVESAGRTSSPVLQVAEVDLINTTTCDKLLKSKCNRLWCGVQDTQICAGKLSGGVDACQGDSGGPLQVKINLPPTAEGAMHYVIGVTSFGFGCALENTPGVYTRVSPFLDWIENIVWKKNG